MLSAKPCVSTTTDSVFSNQEVGGERLLAYVKVGSRLSDARAIPEQRHWGERPTLAVAAGEGKEFDVFEAASVDARSERITGYLISGHRIERREC